MFKKRKRESTTEEMPDSIAPWEMLHEDDTERYTERVSKRYPTLKVFARRTDTGDLAGFNMGDDGKANSVIVVNAAQTERKHYANFTAWFDSALQDAKLS